MTVKKVILSGGLLLLIIAVMAVSSLLENSKEKKTFAPFFPKFAENAGKIVLSRGEQSITLSKNNNLWSVAFSAIPDLTYPADSVKVLSIIDKIADMKGDNFVGKNSENFTEYGLDGDTVYSVQIFNSKNKQLGDFLLGKKSENWRFNYFRLAGDNSVYLVGGGIGFAFSDDINEWRNKKIFDFNPKKIVKIESVQEGVEINIQKDSANVWTYDDGTIADSDSVASLIGNFANLEANNWDYSYSEPNDTNGLVNPTAKYTLISEDGTENSLVVGNMDGERPRFFVLYNNNPQTAFLLRSQVMRLRFE